MSDCQGTAVCGAGQGAAGIKTPDTVFNRYGIRYFLYSLGNTAQRASGDFARHLLANFPSYFTKMLVNTS
ncbi:MAG: hypothetical protein KH326_06115, partial [Ruminococcus callidus]|uniref:hypothetical protein n=1 Tax=Ruminococcus callidus TaxID=40519 RepID=UPI0023EFD4BF